MGQRALVCMSGGVDSTLAALLLRDRGWETEGITYWFWSFPGAPDYAGRTKCCSLNLAAQAAREVGIPHRTVNASDAFQRLVLDDFVVRYRRGETPNPCGRCNRHVRFGLALALAETNGFDCVATGHHVRILRDAAGRPQLHRGQDPNKDQSYFLYGLTKADLEHLRFPVGDLTKDQVFASARARGLSAAALPESQDLCFAQGGRADFLFQAEDFRPGPILDLQGSRLGTHDGLPRYTIGQRRGLGISAERPLYVVALDPARNAIVVGEDADLFGSGLVAEDANFLSGTPPADGARVSAKIRYRSPAMPATYRHHEPEGFAVHFNTPQRAITPGQIVALYDGDRLLGGGTIVARLAEGCRDSLWPSRTPAIIRDWRGGRADETTGLENRRAHEAPRVRIPPPPPDTADVSPGGKLTPWRTLR